MESKPKVKEEATKNRRTRHAKNLMDLVNNRVELMQELFPCFTRQELHELMPDCLKELPVKNVEELCLEELLGISSKRLRAVISGIAPPSDTDSSSDDGHGIMSLDSISSDEAVLNKIEETKKKRRKLKKRSKKKVHKERPEPSVAERGGLTVLELIELQARARAIRAQLQAEPQPATSTAVEDDDVKIKAVKHENASVVHEVSADEDDDVVIKEEPPEVVELSSDDEDIGEVKPNETLLQLQKPFVFKGNNKEEDKETNNDDPSKSEISASPHVIKTNDFTIITPKAPHKKIKLNRVKFAPKATEKKSSDEIVANKPATNNKPDQPNHDKKGSASKVVKPKLLTSEMPAKTAEPAPKIAGPAAKIAEPAAKIAETAAKIAEPAAKIAKPAAKIPEAPAEPKTKPKSKKKKKSRTKSANRSSEKEDSDRDEIMLQLSDSEKMDVLEEFYSEKKAKQPSSNSDDSEWSSSEDEAKTHDLERKDLEPKTKPLKEVESENQDQIQESNNEVERALEPNLNVDKTLEQQDIAAREITESDSQGSKDLAVSENVTNTNEAKENLDADEINIQNAGQCADSEANQPKETIAADEINNKTEELCHIKEANKAKENIVANEINKDPVASTDDKCDDIEEKDSSNESQDLQIHYRTEQISKHCGKKTEIIIIYQTAEEPLVKKDSALSIAKTAVKSTLDSVTEEAINESHGDPKTDSTEVSPEHTKDMQSPSQSKTVKKKKAKKNKKGKKGKKKNK